MKIGKILLKKRERILSLFCFFTLLTIISYAIFSSILFMYFFIHINLFIFIFGYGTFVSSIHSNEWNSLDSKYNNRNINKKKVSK